MSIRDADGYLPLREYGAIGDGRTVALVGPDGRIDWWPVPDLDCPPAFAAMVDERNGGRLELAPDAPFTTEQRYLPGTNVLETVFRTAEGSVRVTDSLNSGVAGRLPWTELARRIDGLSGTVRLRWRVAPGLQLDGSGPWVADSPSGPILRSGQATLGVRGIEHGAVAGDREITGVVVTRAGHRQLVAVVATAGEPLNLPPATDIDRRVDLSIDSWTRWTDSCDYDGRQAEVVLRSALALKLLIYSPTGAIAAAATTSLPESLAGGKNWDYRYAWVRDAAHTIRALGVVGVKEEVHAAVSWLLNTLRAHGPHVFTRLSGEVKDGHRETRSPGWRGIGPVIVGNRAAQQLQLGMFGDVFDVLRVYVDEGHVLDPATGSMLADLADLCCDQWRSRDAGIWELQEERHYTSSKIQCWQALGCAIHLADLGQIPDRRQRWRLEQQDIAEFIHTRCWNPDLGAYTWYQGTDGLDASVLLAKDFDDGPRMSSTIDVIRERLGTGPLLHRYTGADAEEGAFVACSFWMVSALARVGRVSEAAALFDEIVELASPLGLLSEMIATDDGQFLGNLPQGLTHLALILAADALDRAARDAGGAGPTG
ncbi:glycoside hydrolase family 15 protein [Nakamurella flava]|uniref:glycoside hydrolase family 15 protein n=1 Tax=Nakamurella flava TaxID=2576308 RepID=UPI00197B7C54|nr:glycoside hydrolase family 15 protein [Nakamurella flava]